MPPSSFSRPPTAAAAGRTSSCRSARRSTSRCAAEPAGAPLGEVFSFLSGLYFRGKLAYARAFASVPEGRIGGGRRSVRHHAERRAAFTRYPGDACRLAQVCGRRRVGRQSGLSPAARAKREGACRRIGPDCPVVLLGSIASAKYVDVLRDFRRPVAVPAGVRRTRRHEPRRIDAAVCRVRRATDTRARGRGHPPRGPASAARPGDTRQVRRSVGPSGNARAPTRILSIPGLRPDPGSVACGGPRPPAPLARRRAVRA